MSSTQTINEQSPQTPSAGTVDLKLEVVVIPVSDVDRAKRFYGSLGWRLDADFAFPNGLRVVQFTPPGSASSIQFGTKMTSAAPGSAQSLYLVVSDIEAARRELAALGAEIGEVFHPTTPGAQFQSNGTSGRVSGPAPDHASYRSFATFSDPDGNSWLLQEIKTRLPGRGLSTIDVPTLTELLADAEKLHGEYGSKAPKHHWSQWYAGYIVARERGRTSEEAANDATLRIAGRSGQAQA
jgi:catechol 2,3-dioxygenase-like lactoylglutathione lyase family enzyme